MHWHFMMNKSSLTLWILKWLSFPLVRILIFPLPFFHYCCTEVFFLLIFTNLLHACTKFQCSASLFLEFMAVSHDQNSQKELIYGSGISPTDLFFHEHLHPIFSLIIFWWAFFCRPEIWVSFCGIGSLGTECLPLQHWSFLAVTANLSFQLYF